MNTFKDAAYFPPNDAAPSDYFMVGNYLAVGVTGSGTLGTYTMCPGCPGVSRQVGLRQDKDGWDQGAATTTGDFFMTKAVAATRSTQESPAKELFEWCNRLLFYVISEASRTG